MFVDKVKIFVKAGNGGDGHVSFRREKYVQAGGPDGGDGGNGGDITVIATDRLRTLLPFRFERHYRAENGGQGLPRERHGKNGEGITIQVPVGTVIRDSSTGKIIADMHEDGQKKVLLKGGIGGKGNVHFKNSTRQAPKFALPGGKTTEHEIVLELKTIADIGLVGFPNVGKSTLLSVITGAKPKIANYHFTTLSPNIGILKVHENSYTVADIPGLIEGASSGVGLGHDFLRHVERTRMLVHVIDGSGQEGRDPVEDFHAITAELEQYNGELAARPTVIACNKMDLPQAEENYQRLQEAFPAIQIFPISAATHQGLKELLDTCDTMLQEIPVVPAFEEEDILMDKVPKEYEIEKKGEIFYLTGSLVDDLIDRIYLKDPDSMRFFQRTLVNSGVIEKLREMGAKDGDTIDLYGNQFDFVE